MFRILFALNDGTPRTLAELGADLGLEQSTLNRQVNAAIKDGYVERFAEPGRASRLLRPTDDGSEAFARDARTRFARIVAALNTLDPRHAADLLAALRTLNGELDD